MQKKWSRKEMSVFCLGVTFLQLLLFLLSSRSPSRCWAYLLFANDFSCSFRWYVSLRKEAFCLLEIKKFPKGDWFLLVAIFLVFRFHVSEGRSLTISVARLTFTIFFTVGLNGRLIFLILLVEIVSFADVFSEIDSLITKQDKICSRLVILPSHLSRMRDP